MSSEAKRTVFMKSMNGYFLRSWNKKGELIFDEQLRKKSIFQFYEAWKIEAYVPLDDTKANYQWPAITMICSGDTDIDHLEHSGWSCPIHEMWWTSEDEEMEK